MIGVNGGKWAKPANSVICKGGDACAAKAISKAILVDACLRLPEIARIFMMPISPAAPYFVSKGQGPQRAEAKQHLPLPGKILPIYNLGHNAYKPSSMVDNRDP